MLFLIGMGLWDENDITLKGYEIARKADEVYIEYYTSILMGTSHKKIEELIGRKIGIFQRSDLEEGSKKIIERSSDKDVAILIPGDPMIATTHSSILLDAEKSGVDVNIIHNASIHTAVCGLTGLHNYKFGKSTSISYPQRNIISKAPLRVISDNWEINAHTILFLDLHPEPMTANLGIELLMKSDANNILDGCYAIGIARAGSKKPYIRCDKMELLKNENFGPPLHILVIPSKKLHFMEIEFLREFASAPSGLEENLE